MIISFSTIKKLKDSNMYISKGNNEIYDCINNPVNREGTFNLNQYSEVTFDVSDTDNQNVFEEISANTRIYIDDLGWWVATTPTYTNENGIKTKKCKLYSCEYELSQKNLNSFYINSGEDGSIDAVTFYNTEDTSKSLLHLALAKIPNWTISYIHPDLVNKQRTFSIDSINVYSFLTEEVAKTLQCIFTFDTENFTISAYPIDKFGTYMDVYLSNDNVIKTLTQSPIDENGITNCIRVTGSEDLDIRAVNCGFEYIYDLTYFYDRMSSSLHSAWLTYIDLWEDNIDAFKTYQLQYNEIETSMANLKNKQPDDVESENWEDYGIDELNATLESINTTIADYQEQGYDHSSSPYYPAYLKYLAKRKQITNELTNKNTQYNNYQAQLGTISANIISLKSTVSMANNFTAEQLAELSHFVKEGDYNDNTFAITDIYTEAQIQQKQYDLRRSAKKALSSLAQPQYEIQTDIINLTKIPEFESNFEKLELGNFIVVYLNDNYSLDERLISIQANFDNSEDFNITFSNSTRSVSGMSDLDYLLDNVTGVASSSYSNSGSSSGGGSSTSSGDYVTRSELSLALMNMSIDNSAAFTNEQLAILQDMVDGKFDTIDATYIYSKLIEASQAQFDELASHIITADWVSANEAVFNFVTTEVFNADVGNIKTILSGSIGTGTLQTIILTSENSTVDQSFANVLMANYINAFAIFGSKISTNDFEVGSDDGKLSIVDNTIIIKDDNDVTRVQIGEDANGNFTFAILDNTGTGTIINADGVTENAIADGLIKADKLANKTTGYNGITSDKLDINSVVTGINNGTTTINSAQIYFDADSQTLNEKFSEMNTTVGEIGTTVESQGTNIATNAQGIQTLITNTTIDNGDGTATQLKDAYNSTKDTVSQHTQTIGNMETTIDEATGSISTLQTDVSSMSQDLSGFKQTVSSTYTTKSEFGSLKIGGRNLCQNSNSINLFSYVTSGSFTTNWVDDANFLGKKHFEAKCTVTPKSAGGYFVPFLCISGKQYTWSFYAKSSVERVHRVGNENGGIKDIIVTTEWQKFTHTFTANDNELHKTFVFYNNHVINDILYIADFKIEEGDIATSWTSAPEDTDADIDNINNKFNNYSTTTQMNSAIKQTADSINLTVSQTISSVEADLGTKASTSSVNSLSEDLADFSNETIETLSSMQNQIDGSIMTWFYSVPPTTSNTPANGWATVNDKNKHLGDLYYDTVTGYCYRWQVLNNTYSWQRITDTDVTKALEDASKAQDTADSKRRVFTTTPTTPYEIGDLWSGGSSGELKRCKVTRLTGSYTSSDWELATRYTDDTTANQIANNLSANYSTTTHMNSAITQKANEIISNVSSTYTTKSEFGSLKIGGRNLCQNSNSINLFSYVTSGSFTTNWVDDANFLGKKHFEAKCTVTPKGAGGYFVPFLCISGKQYTWSFYAKSSVERVHRVGNENGGIKDIIVTTEWQKFTHTFTANDNELHKTFVFYNNHVINDILYIADFKIEEGDIATSWTSAPEDTDADIDNINNKFNNYSTTTQMNSAIKQTADSINLTVSEKITETNDGTVDEKSGTELHSTLSHDSYCLLTEIDGVTYQASPPTVATPVEINNIPATFNITSQGTEKTHTEQIKLSAPLCYADKIVMATGDITINGQIVKKGDWYVVRNSKKMRFDYEAHVTTQGSTGTYTRFLITPKTPAPAKDPTTAQYSNKYKFSRDYNSDTEHFFVSETSGIIVVFDTATTVTEFKNKLASKALEVEYQLAIPEYEILNDETQDALHNIVTYAGNTLITCDTTLKPNMHGIFKSNLYGKTQDNKSEIDQQAGQIVMKVDSDGKLVQAELNADAESGSTFNVKADNIILDGNVTLGDWQDAEDQTKINGGSLKNNSISTDKLIANSVTADKISTDALKSRNYVPNGMGCFLDLYNGAFSSKNLSWTSNGTLTAANAILSGKVTASNGKIGGFTINAAGDDKYVTTGSLYARSDTGTAPGTANYVCMAPVKINSRYEDTWVMSCFHADIDSSGVESGTVHAYWYITAGGFFYTNNIYAEYDVWAKKNIIAGESIVVGDKLIIGGNTNSTTKTYIIDDAYGYMRLYINNIQLLRLETNKLTTSLPMQFSGTSYPQIYGNGTALHLNYDNVSSSGLVITPYCARPARDNSHSLGNTDYRWSVIYAASSAIITSDRYEKNTINNLDDDLALSFVMGLQPSSYVFNDNTSGRTHYGLISQDVEDLMINLGMASTDFAGFIKSPKVVETEIKKLDEEGNPVLDDEGNEQTEIKTEIIEGEYKYGLRYEEFIAPIIKTVQIQQNEINKLKSENYILKKNYEDLLARIETLEKTEGNE